MSSRPDTLLNRSEAAAVDIVRARIGASWRPLLYQYAVSSVDPGEKVERLSERLRDEWHGFVAAKGGGVREQLDWDSVAGCLLAEWSDDESG